MNGYKDEFEISAFHEPPIKQKRETNASAIINYFYRIYTMLACT